MIPTQRCGRESETQVGWKAGAHHLGSSLPDYVTHLIRVQDIALWRQLAGLSTRQEPPMLRQAIYCLSKVCLSCHTSAACVVCNAMKQIVMAHKRGTSLSHGMAMPARASVVCSISRWCSQQPDLSHCHALTHVHL